jgi:hypothetical protein
MSVSDSPFDTTLDPHQRATFCYYCVGGLVTRGQREIAVEIIETAIRSAQHDVLLEAAKLVLTGEPVEVPRLLREMADRTIRPKPKH